jgi:hypothetical protein
MLPSLFRAPGPTLLDKVRFLLASFRIKFIGEKALEALDSTSFADWLKARGQSPANVQWFWEPFVKGVCNGRLEEVSARHALYMIRVSLLNSPEASAICLLRKPLSAVFDRHARQALLAAGAYVRAGESVASVAPGSPVEIRTTRGEILAFDRVILALPIKYARTLMPAVPLPEPPQEGAIAGLLLRFARPVMTDLFFTAVGTPVQHAFNKTAIRGESPADGSQVVELVLSAAEREVKLGLEGLCAELLPPLGQLLPAVRETPILNKRILIHATATFRVTPGAERHRLALPKDVPGVLFAGDYAAVGLPSTMEGAALAGEQAARDVLPSITARKPPNGLAGDPLPQASESPHVGTGQPNP